MAKATTPRAARRSIPSASVSGWRKPISTSPSRSRSDSSALGFCTLAIASVWPQAAMTHLVETYGLGLLFVLVMLESAGIPLPGETALIGAALLAGQGHFNIAWVIVVAATAAILGDNGGYWVARIWGRKLLT